MAICVAEEFEKGLIFIERVFWRLVVGWDEALDVTDKSFVGDGRGVGGLMGS